VNLDDEEMNFAPPAGHSWDRGLSICRTREYVVIAESITKCLDVFSLTGKFA